MTSYVKLGNQGHPWHNLTESLFGTDLDDEPEYNDDDQSLFEVE